LQSSARKRAQKTGPRGTAGRQGKSPRGEAAWAGAPPSLQGLAHSPPGTTDSGGRGAVDAPATLNSGLSRTRTERCSGATPAVAHGLTPEPDGVAIAVWYASRSRALLASSAAPRGGPWLGASAEAGRDHGVRCRGPTPKRALIGGASSPT